jgi:hypothetical protein
MSQAISRRWLYVSWDWRLSTGVTAGLKCVRAHGLLQAKAAQPVVTARPAGCTAAFHVLAGRCPHIVLEGQNPTYEETQ